MAAAEKALNRVVKFLFKTDARAFPEFTFPHLFCVFFLPEWTVNFQMQNSLIKRADIFNLNVG